MSPAAVHLVALCHQHHLLLGTPVLAITLLLVIFERVFHLGIFDPTLGGDPLLFQHLFWFYSHPAVYIMILPAMGVVSEIIPCFTRKRIFGYKAIAYGEHRHCGLRISGLGRTTCSSPACRFMSAMIFSMFSYLVAVPSAIKVFNWTATMYKGSISFTTPMLYAFGFIGLFTMGGLDRTVRGRAGRQCARHDTYFIIAHFHYIMVGGAVMGYLGGLHFWWPKISGRMYPEGWGRLAALIVFLGFQPDVLPAVHSGLSGNAAAVLAVSAGISGAERAFDSGVHNSGHRLPAADGVFLVVHAVRKGRRRQPLGRCGFGMEDLFAAADLQF